MAHKGTLFLDEIAEMPTSLQGKLLRTLEEKKIRRVGGTREIPIDVRILAATNASVKERLESGQFREELYFRLNVFTIALPLLHDRAEDVPLLAQTFLEEYAQENGKSIAGFSQEALDLLRQYDWPGNVRELRNAIQRAVILCQGVEIQARELPPVVRPAVRRKRGETNSLQVTVGTPLSEVEKHLILETLESNGGNKTRTASQLGISAKTLHNKLRIYREAEGTQAGGVG